MVLLETCDTCGFGETWDGGSAAEDPGVEHARESGHTVTTRVVDEDTDILECEHCGVPVPETEAVTGASGVEASGAKKLAEGQSVGADELFAFENPYCSMGCALGTGGHDE